MNAPTNPSLPSVTHAALFALLAAGLFSLMGVAIKLAAAELNNPMVVFLRNLFGLLLLAPMLLRQGLGRLKTERFTMHLARCGIGLSAMYCFFYAIAQIPLAEAMLLNYATPLYVPLIAWLWLGERPGLPIFGIVLLGLLGVGLILQPGQPGSHGITGLIALLSGILAAGAFVAIRRLSSTEPPLRIVFYFTAIGLVISTLPAAWVWQSPSWSAILLMLAAGGFASGGQLALTRAYGLAKAARVAPFNYLVVVFAALWGWLFWSETPNAWTALGALVVVGSSLLSLRLRQ